MTRTTKASELDCLPLRQFFSVYIRFGDQDTHGTITEHPEKPDLCLETSHLYPTCEYCVVHDRSISFWQPAEQGEVI